MVLVRVKLISICRNPEVLNPGMICFSRLDKSDKPKLYRLTEENYLNVSDQHQPVNLYLVDEFDKFDTKVDSLFLFTFKDGSQPVEAYFDDLLGYPIDDAKLIIAKEDQIAYTENDPHLFREIDDKDCYDIFDQEVCSTINKIIDNDGLCSILCKDEFTHPEEYKNYAWGEGNPIPFLRNNKILIYV